MYFGRRIPQIRFDFYIGRPFPCSLLVFSNKKTILPTTTNKCSSCIWIRDINIGPVANLIQTLWSLILLSLWLNCSNLLTQSPTCDLLIVERDFNLVGDGLLRRVGDQALAPSKDLDLIRHVAVVDRDFELAFAGLWRVDPECAQNANDAVCDVRHLRTGRSDWWLTCSVTVLGDFSPFGWLLKPLATYFAPMDQILGEFLKRVQKSFGSVPLTAILQSELR